MTKIVRVPLICATVNNNGEEVDYKKVNEILWDLQRQTRDIRNKSLQYAWEWLGFSNDYKEQYEEYPKEKDFLNYTLSGYVYDKLKSSGKYTLYTSNMSSSSRDALAKFNGMKKEIFEMVYLDGMTQKEAGESLGYTQARVSQVMKDL